MLTEFGDYGERTIYEPPPPIELNWWLNLPLGLAHGVGLAVDRFNAIVCELPAVLVLAVVGVFVGLCNTPPSYPTAAMLVATGLYWFLVMTIGRRTLRLIVAAALVFEIYCLLTGGWYLPSTIKA